MNSPHNKNDTTHASITQNRTPSPLHRTQKIPETQKKLANRTATVTVIDSKTTTSSSIFSQTDYFKSIAIPKVKIGLISKTLAELEINARETIAHRITALDLIVFSSGVQTSFLTKFMPLAFGNLTLMFVWLSIAAYLCQQKIAKDSILKEN